MPHQQSSITVLVDSRGTIDYISEDGAALGLAANVGIGQDWCTLFPDTEGEATVREGFAGLEGGGRICQVALANANGKPIKVEMIRLSEDREGRYAITV